MGKGLAGCLSFAALGKGGDSYFRLKLLRAGVGFSRWRAAQQAFGAEVFVEVGPVDAVASAGNRPVFALRGGGIE
jgi:hypothetical protein